MTRPTIWTAGFNAFHQLSNIESDVWDFKPLVLESTELTPVNNDELDVFYAGWSSTALRRGIHLHSLGFQKVVTGISSAVRSDRLKNSFGDDEHGLRGCLDTEGHVLMLRDPETDNKMTVAPVSSSDASLISNLALAGNGRVAVILKQTLRARNTHIAEFRSFDDFHKWHMDPSNDENYAAENHVLPGRSKQLLANAANFILLMEDGRVYTWGDARFRTLARPIAGKGAVPANEPGLVEALYGLIIASIQCGPGVGWLAAALSDDGALYLWGTATPGEDGVIACLNEAGMGEVALVEVTPEINSEPADITSAAVGRNHVAVVTSNGLLFVLGDNANGQLGLSKEYSFVEDWTHVTSLQGLKRVVAGPKATFAFLQ